MWVTPPPAECRACGGPLDGMPVAGRKWAHSWDLEVTRKVTGWLLPGLECGCCRAVTFAAAPAGLQAGTVAYGPGLNAAAVLLTACGNVPPERTAQVIGMLGGFPVSSGWVDKASSRLSGRLERAGLDAAMTAALAAEPVLAADETPVSVIAPGPAGEGEQDGGAPAGSPHVLVIRTPGGELTWMTAIASRRKDAIGAGIPAAFTGILMTDGYSGYQHLLDRIAGIAASTSRGEPGPSSRSAPGPCSPGPATSSPWF